MECDCSNEKGSGAVSAGVGQVAVATDNAAQPVAGGTVSPARLALAEGAEVTAQQAVAVVFSDRYGHSAAETHRSNLRAGFAGVAGTAETASLEANSIAIALSGAPLNRADSPEGLGAGE